MMQIINRKFFLSIVTIFIIASFVGPSSISSVEGTCGYCDSHEMEIYIHDLSIENPRLSFDHPETGLVEIKEPFSRPSTDDVKTIFLTGSISGRGPLSHPGEIMGIPNMLVDVVLVGPDGKKRKFDSPIYTKYDGFFSCEFKIGKDTPIGEYTIHIIVPGKTEKLTFEVIESSYNALFMTSGLYSGFGINFYLNGESEGQLKEGENINIQKPFGTAYKASVDEFVIDEEIFWCPQYQKEISDGGTYVFDYNRINVIFFDVDTGSSLKSGFSEKRRVLVDDLDPSDFISEEGCRACADLEERVAELEATTARHPNSKLSVKLSGRVNEALFWYDPGAEYEAQAVETLQVDPVTQLRFKEWSHYTFSDEGNKFTSNDPIIKINLVNTGELTLFYVPYYLVEIKSNVESVGYSGYHKVGNEVPLTIPHGFFTHDPFGFLGEKKLNNLIVLEGEARSLFGPEWLDSPGDLGSFTSNPELEDFKDEQYKAESGEEYLHYVDKPTIIVAEYTDDYTKLMIIIGLLAAGIIGISAFKLFLKKRAKSRMNFRVRGVPTNNKRGNLKGIPHPSFPYKRAR